MIHSTVMALIFTSYILLFFSIHLYMDIQMVRSRRENRESTKSHSDEFNIPLWAKILAFTPSFVFWGLFLVSPFLLYYKGYAWLSFVLWRSPHENAIQGIGLVMILVAILLADWGRVSRGVIAPSAAMPDTYKISTRGAYNIMRHPMYVSYSLFFVGTPLAFLNLLLFGCVLGILGYYRIAQEEERVLTNRFGEEYIQYKKRVGMFIPRMRKKSQ
ncbi:MAG: isoprenylcysteine carboxylmethyltransferase family protein [Theionarchaea archaeon]|nr:isoprenylcysteine carboxylmethyltransferase family protein [Theionarchaea archaeon]